MLSIFFFFLLDGTKQTTITWQQASYATNGEAADATNASYASNASRPSWSLVMKQACHEILNKSFYYYKLLWYCAVFVRAQESNTGQKDPFLIWYFFIHKLSSFLKRKFSGHHFFVQNVHWLAQISSSKLSSYQIQKGKRPLELSLIILKYQPAAKIIFQKFEKQPLTQKIYVSLQIILNHCIRHIRLCLFDVNLFLFFLNWERHGRSWANIYGSRVGWLEKTRMSTQPIGYLY